MTTAPIAPGHYLREDAAASYQRMRAAGCPAGITSSTRTYAEQQALYEHQGDPGWPAQADHPDRSKHVWRPADSRDTGARALDLPEPARGWVRARGAAYGWMKDRVSGEVWHMEYEPTHDQHQEDDMPLTQDDLEKIKAAAANGAAQLLAEAANPAAGDAGKRGRAARDAIRAIVATPATSVTIDVDALATRLAALLKVTPAAIAKAVNDDAAQRLKA